MDAAPIDRNEFSSPHGEPFGAESSVESGFDVFIAFSKLDTVRKMKLFDLLCGHRAVAYKATMKSFWPESTEEDARKLSMMMRSRMERLKTTV
ncbi:MAG: hypothetical protein KDJ26_02190 [Alphaproteobacteria bacterium]|jgi:hypothetical protein|nr:hypothetical protein [Alphaproteobacteria bacterium]MCB1550791.1 hypothetical protein [Alphaproteobacteria bacterium]MCB9984956.1 hypothetical protein [Micavibrio sp.]HRK97347.1 hypothetical protein [Alphaproteobacteria bacterium]